MSRLLNHLDQPAYIATATHEGQRVGFVLSWLAQASLNQTAPMVVLVVSPFNASFAVIEKAKKLTLNVVSAAQVQSFFRFGTTTSRDVDKFEGEAFAVTSFGVELEEALGHVDLEVEQIFPTPDRRILYARVVRETPLSSRPPTLRELLALLSEPQRGALEAKMARDTRRDESLFTGAEDS